jgi:PAS domain S-box-containing protein
MTARPDGGDRQASILIVDDECLNRQLLEAMLAPEGFRLQTAASGKEALALLAHNPPDLILLDVRMPDQDGYAVARVIKDDAATTRIPILIVTALDDRQARMLALAAGAEDYLTKPVDRAELCARVRNLLRIKSYGEYHDTYSRSLEGEISTRTFELAERANTLEQQAVVLTKQAALLDLAHGAIIVGDMNSRISFWNRGAEVMYGWLSHEAVGSISYELLRTEFAEPRERVEAALIRDGHWEGEPAQYRRDGTRLVVDSRWALQRDGQGKPLRILTINYDITDRKKAEADRQLLTERLSLATAVARVGVWEWDLASNALTWDATMFGIYGFAPVDSLLYERWSAAVHPDDLTRVEAQLQKAVAGAGEASSEFRITRADGVERDVSAIQRAVVDGHGRVIRVLGVNVDVTERKLAERVQLQAGHDQVRFKDEFLSHVSHELRSPLTAIKQFTSIFLGGLAGDLTDDQRKYHQIVLKNVQQLQAMIDDLLEVTRLETGKLTIEAERVSIPSVVADSLDTLAGTAQAKGVSLTSDLLEDLPFAHADRTRLRQILIILLDNAIKFTPTGGVVRIHAGVLPRDPAFLLLEVSDTGCGISPEIREKIFERHYQVQEHAPGSRKGLGLGLYICKQLVTRQGGEIWAENQEPEGSTFSFTLPVVAPAAASEPLAGTPWPAASTGLVLVEICFLDAWPDSQAQQDWSDEARRRLRHNVLSDMDVLLPERIPGGQGERFCVVASLAPETDAAELAGKIREQFMCLPRLQQTRVTVSVSYSALPASRSPGVSMEGLVASLTNNLDESIRAGILAEAI